jgi:hypothetical protein
MSASAIHKKSLFRHLLRAPVYLYRWRLGPLFGKRFLLLTHTGRRTVAIPNDALFAELRKYECDK